LSFATLLPQAAPEVMSVGASDAAKKDAAPSFWMSFQKAIRRGPLVGVDFEVFRFGIDGDVLAGVFLHVDLRAYHAVEDFVGSFGKFCGVIRHDRLGFGQ
jgi:hypothetical protein